MLTPKILIIDDDLQINHLVGEFLRRHGYTVVCATTGEQGLASALVERPDLIVCDLAMPGMNGLEVITKIRQDKTISGIPVIFLSAYHDREHVRQTMNLGADDFIAKPVELQEVLDAVSARLQREQMRQQREIQHTGQVLAQLLDHGLGQPAHKASPAGSAKETEFQLLNDLFAHKDGTTPPAEMPGAYFLAKVGNHKQYVKISEVKVFLACAEYSEAFWGKDQKMMFHKPMKKWQQELPEKQFLRVHRKAIINLDFLDFVERTATGKFYVHLRDYKDVIAVSERCVPKLNRHLKIFQPTGFKAGTGIIPLAPPLPPHTAPYA